MTFEKSCGGVVFRRDAGECSALLIQHNAGHWAFPKGHVETGETEAQTALREIREETGLDVRLLNDFRHVTRYSPKEGTLKDVVYFLAEYAGGAATPQLSEVQRLIWLPFSQVADTLSFDNDRELFAHAVAFLSGGDA